MPNFQVAQCNSDQGLRMFDEGGYAKYNGGPHLLVDLPEGLKQGGATISVRTKSGRQITFAFNQDIDDMDDYRSVDIYCHNGPGHPDDPEVHCQQAAFLGLGPKVAVAAPKDEVPTTVVVVQLKHEGGP